MEHVTLKMYEKKSKYGKIIFKKLIQKKNLSKKSISIDTKKDFLFMKNFFKNERQLFKTSSLELIKSLE